MKTTPCKICHKGTMTHTGCIERQAQWDAIKDKTYREVCLEDQANYDERIGGDY